MMAPEAEATAHFEREPSMSWILLTIFSAFFLGLYEVSKKLAVNANAVTPTLFFAVLTNAIVWLPFVIWSAVSPDSLPHPLLQVETLSLREHGMLALKSLLVGISWALTYASLKQLPISIASPIRSTGPLWAIFIATTLWGERPNAWQWAGILVLLGSIYAYSLVGRLEGIHFHRDRWIGMLALATLLSSCSGLYDKYLLQNAGLDTSTVQAWFSIDLVLVVLPGFCVWFWRHRESQPFSWRWSILAIGIYLLVSDFLYFTALEQQGALISLISPLRRVSVIISFLLGIYLFEEAYLRRKSACLAMLLFGVALISIAAPR